LSGGTAGLTCGYTLLGADHLLFGTDMPYDAELGSRLLRNTIASIERMTINEQEKEAIYCGNAKKLLHL
jgi:predicted TIM-barrel fold metal-dependent hydrolase